MGATHDDKEAWAAQYKLNEAGRWFPMVIEFVNEARIHYGHVGNAEMVNECDGLQGLFIPLTEKFGEANRKALQEEP